MSKNEKESFVVKTFRTLRLFFWPGGRDGRFVFFGNGGGGEGGLR